MFLMEELKIPVNKEVFLNDREILLVYNRTTSKIFKRFEANRVELSDNMSVLSKIWKIMHSEREQLYLTSACLKNQKKYWKKMLQQ